jgi:hypothetical protein
MTKNPPFHASALLWPPSCPASVTVHTFTLSTIDTSGFSTKTHTKRGVGTVVSKPYLLLEATTSRNKLPQNDLFP